MESISSHTNVKRLKPKKQFTSSSKNNTAKVQPINSIYTTSQLQNPINSNVSKNPFGEIGPNHECSNDAQRFLDFVATIKNNANTVSQFSVLENDTVLGGCESILPNSSTPKLQTIPISTNSSYTPTTSRIILDQLNVEPVSNGNGLNNHFESMQSNRASSERDHRENILKMNCSRDIIIGLNSAIDNLLIILVDQLTIEHSFFQILEKNRQKGVYIEGADIICEQISKQSEKLIINSDKLTIFQRAVNNFLKDSIISQYSLSKQTMGLNMNNNA